MNGRFNNNIPEGKTNKEQRLRFFRVDMLNTHGRCSITLKQTPKRSNRVVFFDDGCAFVLKRWLRTREKLNPPTKALFVSYQSLNRLDRNGLYTAIVNYPTALGLCDPRSKRLEDHFSPHCFRHWFTTWLRRNGMPREFVKELRGDRRKEAMDVYDHIDQEELKRADLRSQAWVYRQDRPYSELGLEVTKPLIPI